MEKVNDTAPFNRCHFFGLFILNGNVEFLFNAQDQFNGIQSHDVFPLKSGLHL
jgi:hypothetical protein